MPIGEKRLRWGRLLKISGIVLLILLGAESILLAIKWPFSRASAIASLEQVSECHVTIGRFHRLFFPHPGYVVNEIRFERNGSVTLATIQKLTCHASWVAMISLTHRIARMDLAGLKVTIPVHVPPPTHGDPPSGIPTTVTDLYANGAVLQIASRRGGSQTEQFSFPQLHLTGLARDKKWGFDIAAVDPNLVGTIDLVGSLGPVRLKKLDSLALNGTFHMHDLELRKYKIVAGRITSDGRLDGVLGKLEIAGKANIPDFEVTRSHHPVRLTAEYNALVNGIKGDIVLQSVVAHLSESILEARGSITGAQRGIVLDVDSRQARIQDLLRLLTQEKPPSMNGNLSMQAHIDLPPGSGPFLKRLRMDGSFRITDGLFTHADTEEKVDQLSARARGLKKDIPNKNVRSDIAGNVEVRNEIATLTGLSFAVPGAVAKGSGTYNLKDDAIDLHGKLAMQTSLSGSMTGFKSILLIPLDPFFKKNGAGAVVPVRVTGTYSNPVFKASL